MPHSEIRGSKLARNSPRLFAACHVLHRLSVPRHPPGALETLDPPVKRTGTNPAPITSRPNSALKAVIVDASRARPIDTHQERQPTTNATVRRSTFVFPIHDVQDPTAPPRARPGAPRQPATTLEGPAPANSALPSGPRRTAGAHGLPPRRSRCAAHDAPLGARCSGRVVEATGFEPVTCCLQSSRSPN